MPTRYTPDEHVSYIRRLPRQRMVASLVVLSEGRLLVVKPTYRDGWLLPGGVVDQDESPARACVREAQEELGLQLALDRLVLVDHAAAAADGSGGSVHFWFSTPDLSAKQIDAITLPPDELEAFRFVTREEAMSMLVPRLAGRLASYTAHDDDAGTLYTENGFTIFTGASRSPVITEQGMEDS